MKRSPAIHGVDVGNTSSTVGTFGDETGSPLDTVTVSANTTDFRPIEEAIRLYPDDTPWYVASVCRPACERLTDWIRSTMPDGPIRILGNHDCPITIDVDNPDQVGIDRLLGAVAANRLRHPDRPAIVVDAGSAITVDAVSSSGSFLGGVIMAGFAMRTRALAQETDVLPQVHATGADKSPPVVGRTTDAAIRSGIFWGTIGSIREVIHRMQSEIGDAQVFVTGGDMVRMTSHLKDEAQFVPHLVLSGIAITVETLGDPA